MTDGAPFSHGRHGINLPLAVTGQEAVWQNVYRQFGLSDREIKEFFVGPAFLPFVWMGCLDGWGGPLPDRWIQEHADLERKILGREREFGMTPVLQGFTGHVPAALTIMSERRRFAPYGVRGGGPGAKGRNTVVSRGRSKVLGSKVNVKLRPGDVLRVETPGGGGYGRPKR